MDSRLYESLMRKAQERKKKQQQELEATSHADEAMFDAEQGLNLAGLTKGLNKAASKFAGAYSTGSDMSHLDDMAKSNLRQADRLNIRIYLLLTKYKNI